MSKSKINPYTVIEDMDKFNKKAEYIKQKLEKKYPKNLDSKK